MSRRAAHFCSHVNCFLQKMWGNLKNGTSEGQHLCGSEIPRVYLSDKGDAGFVRRTERQASIFDFL